MNILAIALQVALGLVFLGAGGSKIVGAPMQVKTFDRLHLPQGFRLIVGVVEIIGALGILVGVTVHWFAAIGAIWLIGVMAGALLAQIRVRDTARRIVPPAVFLVAATIVVALRWSALFGHFI